MLCNLTSIPASNIHIRIHNHIYHELYKSPPRRALLQCLSLRGSLLCAASCDGTARETNPKSTAATESRAAISTPFTTSGYDEQ